MKIEKQYVTIAEAMVITGLSRHTLDRRIKDGTLSKICWSGRILIPISELMPENACKREKGSEE